ncbi:hydantoinase/oxoprolinase family protein [Glaciecola sp. 33A]|jgi:N-methylhydantoinase A|uniref:hydantoinase/oxoprolinase family protein n=1 Tax=Glaciecola sp. 33A TaxID=2057807 RepID=UPI000C33F069|nr:hydantoinase/oxoprolinase family protein [Glaciecola sp. 33A]PKI03032.1 5-oxoprolinase [Glaciecola sp. 33A]
MKSIRAASDIGGTFTDLVYYTVDEKNGLATNIKAVKVHTTPSEYQKGVMNSFDKANVNLSELAFFAHGSTVVINALTERKGVKTGLITTHGFRDILEIARGNRPDFFNLQYQKPTPFIPRYLRHEIKERMDYKGNVLTAIDVQDLYPILEAFKEEGVEAIAVCFLHSYINPKHEELVVSFINEIWPEVALVASHQISREWREYERTNTAALCAYVQPIAEKYLSKMQAALHEREFSGSFYVMQSNGGIDTVDSVKKTPISIVESGPASGVLGAAALGKLINENNIIAFDIGGTTAKCSLIDQGRVNITNQYMIEKDGFSAGYPVMTPVVDIVEIGNGGGSIGWVDEYGKMHVGPQSAGAFPGPVAYGNGGTEPTTTDANLMLGRINPNYFIGGEITADMKAVHDAFEQLGNKLSLTAMEAARGVIKLANHNMCNALKLISINKGYDPRDFALLAFGGGGSMHASTLAVELNIPKVIIPANASVFSAWGMLMSDLRRDYIRTQPVTFSIEHADSISNTLSAMQQEAMEAYQKEGIVKQDIYFEQLLEMRYSGQEHTVQVSVEGSEVSSEYLLKLKTDFNYEYNKKYTYELTNAIELVSYKVTAYAKVDRPSLAKITSTGNIDDAIKDIRKVDFDSAGILNTPIYNRDVLFAGATFSGPAIIEESGSTTVVLPHQQVLVDDYGNLHIEKEAVNHD